MQAKKVKAQRWLKPAIQRKPTRNRLNARDNRKLKAKRSLAPSKRRLRAPTRDSEALRERDKPFRDITDRKRVEETLRDTNQTLNAIVQASPAAIMNFDLDGRVKTWNPAAERIFGWTAQETLGKIAPHVPPGSLAEFQRLRYRVLRGETIHMMDVERKRKDGKPIHLSLSTAATFDASGAMNGWVAVLNDITERKRAEEETARRGAELSVLFQIGQILNKLALSAEILEKIYSIVGQVLDNRNLYIALYDEANQAISFPVYTIDGERRPVASRLLGNGLTEYILRSKAPLLIPRNVPAALEEFGIDLIGRPSRCYLGVPILAGTKILGVIAVQDYERDDVFTEENRDLLATVASQVSTALENARLYEESQRRADEFAALFQTARDLSVQNELPAILEAIVERAVTLVNATSGALLLYDSTKEELEYMLTKNFPATIGTRQKITEGAAGRVAQTRQPMIVKDYSQSEYRLPLFDGVPFHAALLVPMLTAGELVGVLGVAELGASTRKFIEADARLLSLFASQAATAIHAVKLFQETNARAEQLALLYDAGLALNSVLEPHTQLEFLLKIAMRTLRGERAAFLRYKDESNELFFEVGLGYSEEIALMLQNVRYAPGDKRSITSWVAENRLPLYVPDVSTDPRFAGNDPQVRSGMWVPVLHESELLGVLFVASVRVDAFSFQDERLLLLFGNQVAVAMENARLFDETRQRLVEMEGINKISAALRTAETLNEMLPRLLDETLAILGTDAGIIRLYDASEDRLRESVARGWFTQITSTGIRPREGIGGQVFTTGEPYVTREFLSDPLTRESARRQVPSGWGGACVPIRSARQVVGVMFVSVRLPRELIKSEVHLLNTIAEIAGNAIQRMRLHESLLTSYETTLEGWSHALDLRNRETEGHTQPVTEMTLQLARTFGMTEEQLIHVRRGSLLHDIGKMGIPDAILLKPGPLGEEEWAIMHKHPVFAHELLAPIQFLRPALDIPYCHHERWDGAGYPRGLKGEQIPLAARIFAVVDVWDALLSDRPYRKRWATEQVREHIQTLRGTHFDPQVVDAFMKVIGNKIDGG